MKNAHDLVQDAKLHVQEVPLDLAEKPFSRRTF